VVPLLAAAIPGTIVGIVLLQAVPKPVLQMGVGVAVIAAAVVRARADRSARPGASRPARLAVGFTSGALTTATGVTGPPLALWLARRGLTPAELRDSLSAMFLVIGIAAMLGLIPVLHSAHLHPALIAAGLGCVVGGHALGSRAFTRLESHRFERLLLVVIAAAGVASIAVGIGAL
jgi:uncharacterized membrane protein YfcA